MAEKLFHARLTANELAAMPRIRRPLSWCQGPGRERVVAPLSSLFTPRPVRLTRAWVGAV
jgi:hypothetical protein